LKTALPTSLKQLAAERLILLGEGHCLREHALAACSLGQRRAVNSGLIEASSLTTLLSLVEADCGLTLLPEMAIVAGALRGLKLHHQVLSKPKATREIALAYRVTTARLPVIKAIQAFLTP
jgi:LysR family transcriptional regulator, hydrogen peroxide-inducible genes activator